MDLFDCIILSLLCLFFVFALVGLRLRVGCKNKSKPHSISEFSNTTEIEFVARDHMDRIIDDSHYFHRMTPADLSARRCNSIDQYISLYKSSIRPFSKHERDILHALVERCDAYLKTTKHLKNIPFKLAKVDDKIENGWPHTLADTIVLSDTFFKLGSRDQEVTLIHEKIHVYQRTYPLLTHKLIVDYLGYSVSDAVKNHPLARNNPDINNFVYDRNGVSALMIYSSPAPSTIAQARVCKHIGDGEYTPISSADLNLPDEIPQIEHPFEVMASYCPIILTSSSLVKDDGGVSKKIKAWMDEYL